MPPSSNCANFRFGQAKGCAEDCGEGCQNLSQYEDFSTINADIFGSQLPFCDLHGGCARVFILLLTGSRSGR